MMPRLLRRLFSAEALGLILVLAALQIFAYGISSSLSETDTTYLFWVCLLAAALGFVLNRWKWKPILSAAVMAGVGFAGLWILGARLALPLLGLFESIAALLPEFIPALRAQEPLDTSAVLEAWTLISQASSSLAMRWQTWMFGINRNVTVNDPLVRNMIWTFVMWSLAGWTGWFTSRRNAVAALLPEIAMLAAVLSYSEYRVETLWMLVIILMLLMGLWNYKNHTLHWEHRRVDYSDSILYDNTQAVVFLALAIGALALITPSLSWRDIRDFVRARNSNEAAEMLGIRQETIAAQNVSVQKPSLPREHLLTEGFAQSQELVMTVRTGELPPVANPTFAESAPRHYWRSTVYDKYVGAGWVTSTTSPERYRANTPLIPGLLEDYRLLHMNVQLYQPEGRLFWSGILYSADVSFRADWREHPQTDLFADQMALLQADLFAAAASADSYRAEAYIPTATIEELRAASTELPEEIQARYLNLPRDLPERVHELAAEITSGLEPPYDKAKAIESYLRTNYPYDLEVPAPPQNQDVADYFLFDLKKGYCDYYATAMVVLARSSGLPARFVSGYSSGSYDAPNAQYIVRELNAHSWVEIYFPEIGWIEFEPTAAQPEIERIERVAPVPDTPATITPAGKFLFQLIRTRILYWLMPFLFLMVLIGLYFAVLERVWILSMAPDHAIAYLYRRYYRMGRSLTGARPRAETASEFTNKLIHKMEALHARAKQPKATKLFKTDVQQFTNVYLLSLFSNHVVGKQESKLAFNLWKQLRKQLLLARLTDFFANDIKNFSR